MIRRSIALIVAGVLAGCVAALPPPLTADNPASSSAPEASQQPFRNALAVDDLTKKTRQIFAQADKQPDRVSPASTPQPQQMDQMPGMKMP
jgi:hypothetical protein